MSTLSEDLDGVQTLEFSSGRRFIALSTVTAVPYGDDTAHVNVNRTVVDNRDDEHRTHSQDHLSMFVPSGAVARKLGELFMRLSEQLGYAEDGES